MPAVGSIDGEGAGSARLVVLLLSRHAEPQPAEGAPHHRGRTLFPGYSLQAANTSESACSDNGAASAGPRVRGRLLCKPLGPPPLAPHACLRAWCSSEAPWHPLHRTAGPSVAARQTAQHAEHGDSFKRAHRPAARHAAAAASARGGWVCCRCWGADADAGARGILAAPRTSRRSGRDGSACSEDHSQRRTPCTNAAPASTAQHDSPVSATRPSRR